MQKPGTSAETIKENLMNSGANIIGLKSNTGTKLTKGQHNQVDKIVKQEQQESAPEFK
jgi:gas vesicle protein